MRKILLTIVLLGSIFNAKAQWNGNAALNNKIADNTTLSTTKSGVVSIDDGNNNMIIAWVGTSTGTTGSDIYIQKINNDSSLPWGTEKVVCNAVGNQSAINMISDGAGGAILAWTDQRLGTGNGDEVYGQRILADGTLGWATNGLNLSKDGDNASIYKRNAFLEKVSSTEVIVVFGKAGNSADLFAQKCLISTGATQWDSDVSLHGAQDNLQTNPALLADNLGGAIVVWQDPRLVTTNADIYGQKINNNGTLSWGTTGKVLCDAVNSQLSPEIISDNNNGFLVTWNDLRNGGGTNNDIYIQRFDADGNKNSATSWLVNGNLLCGEANQQMDQIIVSTSDGNFVVVWNDRRVTNDRDIYAQKVNLNGGIEWDLNGVPVVALAGSNQGNTGEMSVISAEDGKILINWADERAASGNFDIYAQKLNADGSSAFALNGVLVCSASNNQSFPQMIGDGSNGAIISWRDSRTTANGEIYASRFFSNGTLPVTYTSFSATKNTFNEVLLNWNIASEINTDLYSVERRGENGEFLTIGSLKAQKAGSYNFTDRNPLYGNNYYRIKAKDFDGTLSYTEIKTINIDNLADTKITIYPNPTPDNLNVDINKGGNYNIKLLDQNGKVLIDKLMELKAGSNNLDVSLSLYSSGIYYLTITSDSNYINHKVIKI